MKHVQTFRQTLVITGLTLCSLSDGLIFGQMSGMIYGLDGKEDINLDENDISWIASVINITCFCGFAITAVLTDYYGRRKSITIVSFPVLMCWIMVYFAQDKITLLASRLIVGLAYGGILLLMYANVGEYISPKIRSLCLNIICCVGLTLGTMFGHILSIVMYWRNVALICIIPTALSALLPFFWVESPSWLATKQRYEECEKSFKALHVSSQSSDKELKELIEIEKIKNTIGTKSNNSLFSMVKKYVDACKGRNYQKTLILFMVIGIYRVAGGRVFLNTLVLTMIQEITGTSDILLYTTVVDGFALLGSILSCILVSRFKMRKLLFPSGIVANIVQLILAFSLYFWPKNNDETVAWVKVSLLALYFIIITAGPYGVLETLLSELHPLDIKAVSIFVVGACFGVMQFMNIQISIKMSSAFGYYSIFLLNSIIIFLCLLYLYYFLPETKGRTLQEIEAYFKNGSVQNNNSYIASENKALFNQ